MTLSLQYKRLDIYSLSNTSIWAISVLDTSKNCAFVNLRKRGGANRRDEHLYAIGSLEQSLII
jgi:hypothetical protein